jgi:hypothetical protein
MASVQEIVALVSEIEAASAQDARDASEAAAAVAALRAAGEAHVEAFALRIVSVAETVYRDSDRMILSYPGGRCEAVTAKQLAYMLLSDSVQDVLNGILFSLQSRASSLSDRRDKRQSVEAAKVAAITEIIRAAGK